MFCHIIFIFSLIFNCFLLSFGVQNVKTWGPGLKPDLIVLPARYFFIQSEDKSTDSILNSIIVRVNGLDKSGNRNCRIWTNVLHTTDNIVIVRYKLYEVCYSFNIDVINKQDHASLTPPVHIKGPVYPDDVVCPSEESIDQWLSQNECKSHYPQMTKDLAMFPSIDFDQLHAGAEKTFNHSASMSVCNYVVSNNQVYRRCYGQHTGFKMFMDNILLSLTRKVHLPDVEFWSNLGDWPLTQSVKYPMFSWCGSDDTYDILMPTYDITESSLENMGRVSLDMLSVQGNNQNKWDRKHSKAFWRGRDSNRDRLKLIDIGRGHPDLFNVSLTNFFFFKDEEDKYGPKQKHVSFFEFFDYKYQLNLDGTVAAYRFPYLLAGDSLVFKQDSPYYEHFYTQLQPWEHYVPVKKDLSDLVHRVKWALEHEDKAMDIVRNARAFTRDNLMPLDVVCYHAVLFNEWSKRIESKVRVRDGMELVPQKQSDIVNPCENSRSVHEEL
uniref:KDEL motif-containing protein 1 n=1 Tax=Cacopsylla melanoneura TaxID=428564 RepID=A0A8D8V931_9HEMI